VIIDENGLLLTAGHVVGKPKQEITVFLADGKTTKGETLGMYKTADAGMMRITEKKKWPHAKLGKSENLKRGAWCLAVGHPFGVQKDRPPVVRVGRILGVTKSTIQTDCPLISGDSGGPLFDIDGNVIGINSRIGGTTMHNFHVPVDVFHKHWDRLVKGDSWQLDTPTRMAAPVKAAFRDVVAAAAKCVVRVKCDGKDRALGTIVGPDGWVITKASELTGEKTACRFRDNTELPARVIGIDEKHDLAMLKLEATGLPKIEWASSHPAVGTWVATAGLSDDPLAIGALSVPVRSIPPVPPKLGVVVTDGDNGPLIVRVFPGTGAEQAGLKAKDVITHVDGNEVRNRDALTTHIQKLRIGDTIKLKVLRGDEELDISAKLVKIRNEATRKRDQMNASNVGVSQRRHDLPAVLQHDTVLKPVDCGGPVVDLSGKVVGVNIARGGRTETYCTPSDVLLTRMYDLMSGRLAPEKEIEPESEPRVKPEDMKIDKAEPDKKPDAKPEEQATPTPDKQPQRDQEPKPDAPKEPEPKKAAEAEPKDAEGETPPDKLPPEKKQSSEKKLGESPPTPPNESNGAKETPEPQSNSNDQKVPEEKPNTQADPAK
jgi:serine protease Do